MSDVSALAVPGTFSLSRSSAEQEHALDGEVVAPRGGRDDRASAGAEARRVDAEDPPDELDPSLPIFRHTPRAVPAYSGSFSWSSPPTRAARLPSRRSGGDRPGRSRTSRQAGSGAAVSASSAPFRQAGLSTVRSAPASCDRAPRSSRGPGRRRPRHPPRCARDGRGRAAAPDRCPGARDRTMGAAIWSPPQETTTVHGTTRCPVTMPLATYGSAAT